jgi:hypothetical protein
MNINEKTVNILNVMQNGLIRYMLSLHKSCNMSNIHKSFKILNVKQLICKYKINFVRHVENHVLCKKIYTKMINENIIKKNSNSLLTDIKMISNVLKCKMEEVGKSTNLETDN